MIKNNQFYILRHGETEYLTKKKHLIYPAKGSLKTIGLTPKGRDQIKKTSSYFKKEKISFIYSSDFLRTKQTSMIVAREINLARDKVFFSDKLRDFDWGVINGKAKEKVKEKIKQVYEDFNNKAEKGESLNDVLGRMVSFVEKIDRKHKKERILIVSHGDPLWLLERHFKNKSLARNKNFIQAGETRKLN
jgi:broad specificity phosphatase PhoE